MEDTESTDVGSSSGDMRMTKSKQSSDDWKGVPQWIIDANAKYVPTWVPDTVCVGCKQPIDDQFMDCKCSDKWKRCGKCGEKYRTDFVKGEETENRWCKCG